MRLLVVALVGCGRLGFDAVPAGLATDANDASADAAGPSLQLVVGWTHACVVKPDGVVLCWGSNGNSEIGLGPGADYPTPVATVTDRTHAQVALGQGHTCALDTAGEIRCWGLDANGELGLSPPGCGNGAFDTGELCDDMNTANGDACTSQCQLGAAPPDQPTPTAVGAGRYRQVGASRFSSCAIELDGTLWCWGRNGARQLGVGDNTDRGRPEQVLVVAPQTGPDNQWARVAQGSDHTCALQNDGSLWCWGGDAFGQLAQGANTYVRERPNRITGTGNDAWLDLASGIDFTCGVRSSRELMCWGLNDQYQLGLADVVNRFAATLVDAGPWERVGAGGAHACAIRVDGSLYCWGLNSVGQIGIGTTGGSVMSPTQVPGDWVDVGGGSGYTCAVDRNQDVYCWGNGNNGRLGTGGGSSSTPVKLTL